MGRRCILRLRAEGASDIAVVYTATGAAKAARAATWARSAASLAGPAHVLTLVTGDVRAVATPEDSDDGLCLDPLQRRRPTPEQPELRIGPLWRFGLAEVQPEWTQLDTMTALGWVRHLSDRRAVGWERAVGRTGQTRARCLRRPSAGRNGMGAAGRPTS